VGGGGDARNTSFSVHMAVAQHLENGKLFTIYIADPVAAFADPVATVAAFAAI
jgi:hypothetical protein